MGLDCPRATSRNSENFQSCIHDAIVGQLADPVFERPSETVAYQERRRGPGLLVKFHESRGIWLYVGLSEAQESCYKDLEARKQESSSSVGIFDYVAI